MNTWTPKWTPAADDDLSIFSLSIWDDESSWISIDIDIFKLSSYVFDENQLRIAQWIKQLFFKPSLWSQSTNLCLVITMRSLCLLWGNEEFHSEPVNLGRGVSPYVPQPKTYIYIYYRYYASRFRTVRASPKRAHQALEALTPAPAPEEAHDGFGNGQSLEW